MRRSILAFLLIGCGGSQAEPQPAPTQLECTIDGQKEMRVMRDCSSEISYQEHDLSARVEAFGVELGGESEVQFRPVKSSLMLLTEQQRSMCRDWNACALSREEYVRRSEWLTSQFTTLTQLLDAASPETMQDPAARERTIQQILDWAARARELEVQERVETERNRIAAEQVDVAAQSNEIEAQRLGIDAQSAAAQTDQASSQHRQASAAEEQARIQREMLELQANAMSEAGEMSREARERSRAQLQIQADQFQRKADNARAFLPFIARARTESAGIVQGRRPRICGSGLRAELEPLGRGDDAQVADASRRLVQQIERTCTPFDQWERPTPEILQELGRIPERLGRDEEMAARPGGSNNPPEVAARVVAAIQAAKREIAGSETGRRPFPCLSRTWNQLQELQHAGNAWAGTAAGRAVRHRDSVCRRIGVLPGNLEQSAQAFVRFLDQTEANMRQSAQTYQDSADRVRASMP